MLNQNVFFPFPQATRRFFTKEIKERLTYYDCLDLINLWFVLILISDSCAVLGSMIKLLIDMNVCSSFSLFIIIIIIIIIITYYLLLITKKSLLSGNSKSYSRQVE